MSRSCQSATFSSPACALPRSTRASPVIRSDDDRVALVGHRARALLALPERLLDLAHLGALEVPDLGREPLERGARERDRAQQLGVAVARHDLRRDAARASSPSSLEHRRARPSGSSAE